tara:strand:- start:47 stop:304 length:258 start_codon:yes stop_codon:yes gene_type:complete
METFDFWAELKYFLPILEKHYRGHEVSMVEIVSYQGGGFYYDPWPHGLDYAKSFQAVNPSAPEPNHDYPNEGPSSSDNLPENPRN